MVCCKLPKKLPYNKEDREKLANCAPFQGLILFIFCFFGAVCYGGIYPKNHLIFMIFYLVVAVYFLSYIVAFSPKIIMILFNQETYTWLYETQFKSLKKLKSSCFVVFIASIFSLIPLLADGFLKFKLPEKSGVLFYIFIVLPLFIVNQIGIYFGDAAGSAVKRWIEKDIDQQLEAHKP